MTKNKEKKYFRKINMLFRKKMKTQKVQIVEDGLILEKLIANRIIGVLKQS